MGDLNLGRASRPVAPPGAAPRRTLRVCALYPELMNIYADRGNLLVLERRCAWRGIGFELSTATLGDRIDPDAHDLFYLGGGRDQRLCAHDLVEVKRDALGEAAGRPPSGHPRRVRRLPALGDLLRDGRGGAARHRPRRCAHRARGGQPRLIGNVAIEADLGAASLLLAGFENHGGRTYLGAGERPLGRVIRGHGNNGHDRGEGVRRGTVIGTYLHGPLLPKNTDFADWLIATATGTGELEPLDDELERAAHREAERAVGV